MANRDVSSRVVKELSKKSKCQMEVVLQVFISVQVFSERMEEEGFMAYNGGSHLMRCFHFFCVCGGVSYYRFLYKCSMFRMNLPI